MSNITFQTFSLRKITSKMKKDVNLYNKLYMTVRGTNCLSNKQIDEVIKIIKHDSDRAIVFLNNLKTKNN